MPGAYIVSETKLCGALRKLVAAGLCCCISFGTAWAQTPSISAEKPTGFIAIRPYEPAYVPPVRTGNSLRLGDLIRGGKLYLTAQDAVALALENNIDLEIDRYNPLIGVWNLERAEAGGALPGLPNSNTQSTQVASGQGASGSQSAAGVSTGNTGNGTTGNTVGGTIQQIGAVTPTLDPTVQHTQSYSHISTPQSNTVLTETTNWIQSIHNYTDSISQGLITGGQVSLSYNDSYLHENVASDVLNPSNGTVLQLQIRHNFLAGFGTALNSRTITVQRSTLQLNDLTFRTEVMDTVANVLTLYYTLAADYEDLRAKQSAFDVAQQFYEDNKKQVQIGTMAPLDVTTAQSQVASTQGDLIVSQTTLAEQQISLKNVLSRRGLADPLIANVEIIPLDRIEVPENETLPSNKELVATALKNRADLAGEKINIQNLGVNALNTSNAVLPTLVALANLSQQGLSGVSTPVVIRSGTGQTAGGTTAQKPGIAPCPGAPATGPLCEYSDPYFVGGIGNALGQMIRRNFPSENGGAYFQANFRNRQAQADYRIDQLSMRQSELQSAKDFSQVAVDVSNQSIGLQQARVRYQSAVRNRILQQQLLDAEQKKFRLGASTTYLVVQQQRDLATAQSSEVAAEVAYSNAKVALDQTLGTTLATHGVSLSEAVSGTVVRKSTLPEKLPAQP